VDITELIGPERVMAALPASDKLQLIRELSRRAARYVSIGSEAILDALQAREALGSTGVGQGIAIPHARVAGLQRFLGLFAQLEHPINFDAIDGQPVDLVFLLLIPDQARNEHLSALASISRRLRDPSVAAYLRAAENRAELYEILTSPASS
jgi:PTS system nitrogen regulatory IIA component